MHQIHKINFWSSHFQHFCLTDFTDSLHNTKIFAIEIRVSRLIPRSWWRCPRSSRCWCRGARPAPCWAPRPGPACGGCSQTGPRTAPCQSPSGGSSPAERYQVSITNYKLQQVTILSFDLTIMVVQLGLDVLLLRVIVSSASNTGSHVIRVMDTLQLSLGAPLRGYIFIVSAPCSLSPRPGNEWVTHPLTDDDTEAANDDNITLRSVSSSHWKRQVSGRPWTGRSAQHVGPFSPRTLPLTGGMAGWVTEPPALTRTPPSTLAQWRMLTKSRTLTTPPPASAHTCTHQTWGNISGFSNKDGNI